MLTDCYWLDLNTFLDVRRCWVIRIFVSKNFLAAKSVDESCATCAEVVSRVKPLGDRLGSTGSRSSADHQTELNSLLDIFLPSNLH
jgi:hypothetical protein